MYPPKVQERWALAARGREQQLEQAPALVRDLLLLMADLRGPGGCPWDREQSLASLRQYVREEADEVCQAIDRILEMEADARAQAGLAAADPDPPQAEDKARTAKKGHTIAHHPHRTDFRAEASASGAPLPPLDAQATEALRQAYAELSAELGDLLLQSIFMGDILRAMGRASFEDSVQAIVTKLIRRHPHVYGETAAADSAAVLQNWERIKAQEKRGEL